jgi:hypothetical protein
MSALKNLQARIEERRRKLRDHAEAKYKETWIQYFRNKTKKETWTTLTRQGREYPSLSTFYSHVRSFGLAEVLIRYLSYPDIDTMTRILCPNDVKLMSMIGAIQELEQESLRKERHVRKQLVA